MAPLYTPRLHLRVFEPADAAAVQAVFGDAEVMRYSDAGVQDRAFVEAWIAHCQAHQAQHGYSHWAVVERTSGAVLGYCGLEHTAALGPRPETALGYRLARLYWGQGYATEAAKATLAYAFGSLGLQRVVASVDPHNLASVAVAQKLDMQPEREVWQPGYTHPDCLYVAAAPKY